MKSNKYKLLFFGSDSFSAKILDYLHGEQVCSIRVVTKPETLLDRFAAVLRLERIHWPFNEACQQEDNYNDNQKENEKFNIGLVASFGSMIDEKTVNQFKYGLFNVHPSLLPRYRGSTPIQAAILNGDQETGCTIMRIPPIAKFDIGEVILQQRLAIRKGEYAFQLRDRLADMGARMAEKLLLDYEDCMSNTRSQGSQGVSYAKKMKPEQGLIEFKAHSSTLIERKVRAYTGYIELFMICLNGLKVKLEDMRSPTELENLDLDRLSADQMGIKSVLVRPDDCFDVLSDHVPAGTIYFHKTRHMLCIKCSDNRWIAFDHVTPDSRPKMSGLDFYNGFLSKVDSKSSKTDV